MSHGRSLWMTGTLAPTERTAISISRISAVTVGVRRTVEVLPAPCWERTGGRRADVARWISTIPKYADARYCDFRGNWPLSTKMEWTPPSLRG